MTDRQVVPAIPMPPAKNGPERAWQAAVREILLVRSGRRRGAESHRWLTAQDLSEQLATVRVEPDGSVTTNPSGKPVPPPKDLFIGDSDFGAFSIRLQWENSDATRVAATEVWVSETGSRSDAYRVAVLPVPVSQFTFLPRRVSATHFFWIRHVGPAGLFPSVWEPPDTQGGLAVPGETALSETIDRLMTTLTGQITESQLYNSLNRRIDIIDKNFGFEEDLFEEGITTGGLTDAVSSLFFRTLYARDEAREATAAILEETEVRIAEDAALAAKTTTLETTVGAHTTRLQVQAASINGLEAQYTVKVDANGYVAGYGLAVHPADGTTTSEFIVLVDKFAVVTPGKDPVVPFVVGNVEGVPTTGINGQLIVDGSVTASAIATDGLEVGNNISIQDGAIGIGRIGDSGAITWLSGVDMTGKPAGLYLTSDYMGFYNGSAWADSSWFKADGSVQLAGTGAGLTIRSIGTDSRAELTDGDITFHYRFGEALFPYKSLKRVEMGAAKNGKLVEIPGRFKSKPNIFLYPKRIRSYDTEYASVNQELVFSIIETKSLGEGRYAMRPGAKLVKERGEASATVQPDMIKEEISDEYTLTAPVDECTIEFRIRPVFQFVTEQSLPPHGGVSFGIEAGSITFDVILERWNSSAWKTIYVKELTVTQTTTHMTPTFDPQPGPPPDWTAFSITGRDGDWWDGYERFEKVRIKTSAKTKTLADGTNTDNGYLQFIIDTVSGTSDADEELAAGEVFYVAVE